MFGAQSDTAQLFTAEEAVPYNNIWSETVETTHLGKNSALNSVPI